MMHNHFASILGDRLITITKVYKDTGIARSTLANLYYRKSRNVNFKTLERLCDYLQVPLSELIEYIPNGSKK